MATIAFAKRRPRRVPSAEAIAGVPFAPTREALDDAIALLESQGDGSGSAVGADDRRAALALYESLPIPGTRPSRGWRHDYAKLKLDGRIVKTGGPELAQQIEREGYDRIREEAASASV